MNLKSLIESHVFLFFFSSFAISLILYFPTVAIYALLWILYFYLSSSTEVKDDIFKEKNTEDKYYYELLKSLDDQPNENQSSNFLSDAKKIFHPNTAGSSSQTSIELLYILIDKIISSKQKKGGDEYPLDDWLKSYIGSVLPPGTDKEFEFFVRKNKDEITRKIEFSQNGWKKQLELIMSTEPRPDIIPFDYEQYPGHYQNKKLLFHNRIDEYSDNNKREDRTCVIEGKTLWDLIHGDADFYIQYEDYITWYPKDSKIPFWLIPFSLYRWWTPDNDSFESKFEIFGKLNLSKNTKENMFNDPLYLFISAYIKEKSSLEAKLEMARISSIINDKFEAYCLIDLLQKEQIIKVDPVIFEEVVTQCINYFINTKDFSWPLSAFILKKEENHIQLRQLLETYCEDGIILSKDEKHAIAPYDKEDGRFHIDQDLIYEIKGEKIISKALRISNKKDFIQTFIKGIECLKEAKKYSRIMELLTSYYLKWVAEIGHDYKYLSIIWNDIKRKYPLPKEDTEEYYNYLIIDTISATLDPTEMKYNEDTVKEKDIDKVMEKNEDAVEDNDTPSFKKKIINFLINIGILTEEVKSEEVEENREEEETNKEEKSTEEVKCKEEKRKIVGDILRKGWKTYTLRRFVCSILMKQEGWENYLIGVDGVPQDEVLTYNDTNNIFLFNS